MCMFWMYIAIMVHEINDLLPSIVLARPRPAGNTGVPAGIFPVTVFRPENC